MTDTTKKYFNLAQDYVMITFGLLCYAFGFTAFILPEKIVIGSVTGLSSLIHFWLGWNVAITYYAINIILLCIAFHSVGKQFVLRTVIGATIATIMIGVLQPMFPAPIIEQQTFMNVILGAVLCGFGLGIVFTHNGSTGGTDIIAQVVSRRTSIPMGVASLIADMAVVVLSVPVFGIEKALYATIAMYLGTRVLDMVLDGFNTQRAAYIISDQHERIKKHIFSDLDRGCTELLARGGYTGKERPVIFVVLTRPEMALLRRVVASVDPQATIVVSKIHEAFGNGFEQI